MARPRSSPPGTPFGVWLLEWLDDHPSVTFEAFGKDVKVSKATVSSWIKATRQAEIKYKTLVEVARVTGADMADLERMVYGHTISDAVPAVSVDLLDAIEERMRRAFREELLAALSERQQEEPG